MASNREPTRSLNPGEVIYSGSGGNSSGRRKAAQSRALDLTMARITLRHQPTGIEVTGEVPLGHYTRTRMRQLKDELCRRLFSDLEELVAKYLRVPGR